MDAQHTKHVTYKLAYHFVWCPKYRKKILVGKIAPFLAQEIRRICVENVWPIRAVNIQPDHVPIIEESSEERKERQSRIVTLPEVASPARIAL